MAFMPLSDDNPHHINPVITWGFILFNLAVVIFSQSLAPEARELFFQYLGSVPAELWASLKDTADTGSVPEYLTLLTSNFIHVDPFHFIGNMFFFRIFADNIEDAFGHVRFFLFCILGGIFSSFIHAFIYASSLIPSIGFSGVVSAVLGAYFMLYPKARINLAAPLEFLLFVRSASFTFSLPAALFLGLWFCQDLIGLLTDADGTQGIAFLAHIAGFLFGMGCAKILHVNTTSYELKELSRARRGRIFRRQEVAFEDRFSTIRERATPPGSEDSLSAETPPPADKWGHR